MERGWVRRASEERGGSRLYSFQDVRSTARSERGCCSSRLFRLELVVREQVLERVRDSLGRQRRVEQRELEAVAGEEQQQR